MLKNNQSNIFKKPLKLDEMKYYISKQRDILDSQRCYNDTKTHRTKFKK